MATFTRLTDSVARHDARRAARRGHRLSGDLSTAERGEVTEVTLVLRENPAGPSIADHLDSASSDSLVAKRYAGDADVASLHGASDADWQKASAWALSRGLTVVDEHSDQAGRRLRLRGTVAQIDAALGTRTKRFTWTRPLDGHLIEYRRSLTAPVLPSDVAQVVTAVQGLGSAPMEPRLMRLARGAQARQVYAPEELARLYDFPHLPNGGAGMTVSVGIAELGGAVDPAVAKWFLSQPKYAHCTMTEIAVNHAPIKHDPGGADVEVALDWQVALRALVEAAPKANIHIILSYGENSDQGFADAWNVFVTGHGVTSAKRYDHRHPAGIAVAPGKVRPTSVSGVSTSWGLYESGWSLASIKAMDDVAGAGSLKGVFFANASGDAGSTDGAPGNQLDADAPAVCANVLGVGGTTLHSRNGKITSEVVWNEAAIGEGAGGGGVARSVPEPGYQTAAGIQIKAADDGHTGRVVPDIALDADPLTGYAVVTGMSKTGSPIIEPVGGTSASTPLATAGFALVGAMHQKKLGRIQDTLYTLAKAGKGIRDIVHGNNAYPAGAKGYHAGPGFDAASGWGAPNFAALAHEWSRVVPAPAPALSLPGTPQTSVSGAELS